MKHQTMIAAAALGLVACAGVPTSSMRLATVEKTLIIKEKVVWKRGLWDMTLAPGEYVGKFETDHGTFFVGPSPCMVISGKVRDEPVAGTAWECAVFVPSSSQDAKVMNMAGSNRDHKFYLADGSPDFTQAVPVRQIPGAAPSAPFVLPASGPFVPGATILNILNDAEHGRYFESNSQPEKNWFPKAAQR